MSSESRWSAWATRPRAATATVASYPNLAFAIAKLVPGANGSPSKWVSYIDHHGATQTARAAEAAATRPSTDNTGTLVDNGDGTYRYTFYRDITKIKSQVDGWTFTGNNRKEDLGDLTYDPSLPHRVAIQIERRSPRHRQQHAQRRDGQSGGEPGEPGQRQLRLHAGDRGGHS